MAARGETRFPGERAKVECWCRLKVIEVSMTDIRNGKTGSCGAKECSEDQYNQRFNKRRA